MTNTNFLPDNYEVPAGGNGGYMKFKEGVNKFRTLSRPIIGYVGWLDDKTPKRVHNETDFNGINLRERPKHFWAFVVWNYQTSAVEILEISQATIQRALEALINDPSWGSPFTYDISVTRTGAALDTVYNVQPAPPTALASEIQAALMETPVNLGALYDNDDPFTTAAPATAPIQPAPTPTPPNPTAGLDNAEARAYFEQNDPNQRGPLFDEHGNQVN